MRTAGIFPYGLSCLGLVATLFFGGSLMAGDGDELPRDLGDPAQLGQGIQRTMTLLATSTPERRHTVRLLFYGQSITEQGWWKEVADDLRARFPHADLVIENRALGGFASQRLVRTAESDLYPFRPDLLIFHVFGAHNTYEDIIRRTRERTTAEILIQTDHVSAKADWRQEPTDPSGITPKQWSSFMNYKHLPRVIADYGCGYVDQRNLWKRHLLAEGLESQDLLKDGVHLNEAGSRVMAAFAKAALVKRDDSGQLDPMNCGYVKTFEVGREVAWEEGKVELALEGNRIDLIAAPGAEANAGEALQVRIDGARPSEIAALSHHGRARSKPGGKWPPVAPIGFRETLIPETWTLEAQRDPAVAGRYTFTVSGSQTGPDGEGSSTESFVSRSGRVVIEPEAWDVEYALKLAQVTPVPARFTLTWQVEAAHLDHWAPEPTEPGIENAVTVAHGLEDAPHRLTVTDPSRLLRAIRVYSPKAFPR